MQIKSVIIMNYPVKIYDLLLRFFHYVYLNQYLNL